MAGFIASKIVTLLVLPPAVPQICGVCGGVRPRDSLREQHAAGVKIH